jgi:hypothetical protein
MAPGLRDLHALTREEGNASIAAILKVSVRCLTDLRRGEHPLTIDDLYLLRQHFNDFDLVGTVARIGKRRRHTGKKSHKRSTSKPRTLQHYRKRLPRLLPDT